MSYEVGFKPSALKEIRKLDEAARKVIIAEIELLADNPRPDGCKKLKGEFDLYRIRVLGNYRVIYEIQDRKLIVKLMCI
jgi:mRNA interferase RelE/StbE